MPTTSRAWHLVSRPHGALADDDVALVSSELPDPGPGEVLVRNTWLSVDPYMRGRMNEAKSYVAPFALDAPMDGGAVGVVEQVGDGVSTVSDGDTVLHGLGWREAAVLHGRTAAAVFRRTVLARSCISILWMVKLIGMRRCVATA